MYQIYTFRTILKLIFQIFCFYEMETLNLLIHQITITRTTQVN